MLSPQDITGKVFEKAVFGGYDAKSVDRFLKELAADFETICAERDDFRDKLRLLGEKAEEYRESENAVQQALISAQKSASTLLAEVEAQREQRLTEIRAESEKLLGEEKEKCEALLSEVRANNEKRIAEETEAAEAVLSELRRKREAEENACAEAEKRSAEYLAKLRSAGEEFARQLSAIYGFAERSAEPEQPSAEPESTAEPEQVDAAEPEAQPQEPEEQPAEPEARETQDEIIERSVSAAASVIRQSYSSSEKKSRPAEAGERHLPNDYENLQFGDQYRRKR